MKPEAVLCVRESRIEINFKRKHCTPRIFDFLKCLADCKLLGYGNNHMIRLSEDGKTFVDIQCWEDIIERPGFQQKLNPKEVKLKRIIGQYSINPKQPCGLKNCGTKHNRGYLVEAEDGLETNIGNVCGGKYFGVEFKELQNVFKMDSNAQRYREEIIEKQNQIHAIENTIKSLREGDYKADWCYDGVHSHMTRLFPEFLSDRLISRAKRNNGIVTKEVALSNEERELSSQAGDKSAYRTEQLFVIYGVAAAVSYKKIRNILATFFGGELDTFKNLDVETLDYNSLKTWHNWKNRIDHQLNKLREIIDDCNRFLAKSNIEMIRKYKDYL